jgi:DNA polymerase-3 subunit alpha
MIDFAKYAFNKSHAAAYGVVSYQTAYLKYYYPVEFMASLMTSVIENSSKVAEYIMTCRSMEIEILPPDINESERTFTACGSAIRYGLSALRSIGKNIVDQIVAERRQNGKFENLKEFLERMDGKEMSKRIVESLIKAGALDCFEGSRKQKMIVFGTIMDDISQSRKKSMAGQMSLFDIVSDDLKADFEIKFPEVSEYSKEELLGFEKEVMGLYISGHPLEEYENKWKKHITKTTKDFLLNEEGETEVADGNRETIGGFITEITLKVTKTNGVMAFMSVEDLYGTVEVLVFPKLYEKYRQFIQEDNKVFVSGRVSAKEDANAQLLCDSIKTFDDVTAQLWVRFANKAEYEARENELLEAVATSPGKDNVVVYLKEEKAKKILPAIYQVQAEGELSENLKKMFGNDNVAVVL